MAERLNRFSGELDVESIVAGMNAVVRNAKRLVTDARTLFNLGSHATSASLSILSIEESGKISILRELAVTDSVDSRRAVWRRFRSHTAKNLNWILPTLVAHGARRLNDFRPLVDDEAEHPLLLDQVKQVSIYVDCYADAHWSEPDVVIDGHTAESILRIAEILQPTRETTLREIELWIEHLKPEWGRPMEHMEAALVAWYAAMQAEGLTPDGPNKMSAFIWPGIGRP